MKIALVSEFPFIRPQKGVELRLHQTAELLAEIGTVWPVIVTRLETPADRLNDLRERFGSVTYVIPTEVPAKSVGSKLRRLISRKNVADRGFHISSELHSELIDQLQACDIVWFHSLKAADSLGVYHWPNGILDFDDLHSKKYLQTAKLDHRLKVKIQGSWLALSWRRWEHDALRRFHRVLVCSEEDQRIMGRQDRVAVMPNIFERKVITENPRNPTGDRVGFIGTLEYSANRDGVLWFVEEVLPLLVKLHPTIEFRVAGRIPPAMPPIDHPNVKLLGFVENLADEMASWSASIAPLRVGSGTRLKILESFSRRCPVVTTTLGCYGLNARHRIELLIGDSVEDFAAACDEMCRTPGFGAQLSSAAFLTWQEKYTLNAVRPVVQQLVENCVKRTHP